MKKKVSYSERKEIAQALVEACDGQDRDYLIVCEEVSDRFNVAQSVVEYVYDNLYVNAEPEEFYGVFEDEE